MEQEIILIEMILFIVLNMFWIVLYMKKKSSINQLKKHNEKPFVSIIVPVYNKFDSIERTIKSVYNINYPKKEIIIINDGSTDGSDRKCENLCKNLGIKFLNLKKNIGKALAMNEGIKIAKGEIIVTVDADSFPEKDSLNYLVPYFADKKIGAVAGTIKVSNHKNFITFFQRLEYFQQAFQRITQGFFGAVITTPGPLTAYRKSALEKINGFRNDTLIEDCDVSIRLHKAGYKVIAEDKAISNTIAPDSLKSLHKQRVRWCRGGFQIGHKHFDVLFNRKLGTIGTVFFPLYFLWLFLPFLILPTFLFMAPSSFASFIKGIQSFIGLIGYSLTGFNFQQVFLIIENAIIDFLDIANLNLVRIMGLLSLSIFLLFIVFSIRTIKEKFEPEDLKALILLPIYWFFLLVVFIESLFMEILRIEKKW